MSSTWTVEAIMLIQLDKWRNNAFFLWPCGCLDYITWREWSSTDKWTLSSCELVISWERSGGSLNCISFPWQCSQSNNKKRKRNSSFHQHKESLFSHDRTTQAIIIQSRQHIYLAMCCSRAASRTTRGRRAPPTSVQQQHLSSVVHGVLAGCGGQRPSVSRVLMAGAPSQQPSGTVKLQSSNWNVDGSVTCNICTDREWKRNSEDSTSEQLHITSMWTEGL